MITMQIPTMAQRQTTAPSAFGMSGSSNVSFGHFGTVSNGAAFGATAGFGAMTLGTGVGISPLTQTITGDVRPKAGNGEARYATHPGTPVWRPPLS